MNDDVKMAMRFPRDWLSKAVDEGKMVTVSMFPQGAALMLPPRERMKIETMAPMPRHEEILAYIDRFVPNWDIRNGYMAGYINAFASADIGVTLAANRLTTIHAIAKFKELDPLDVCQDMCVGVPLSDTEFHDYIEAAKANGATHVDPRAMIYTAMPIEGGEVES